MRVASILVVLVLTSCGRTPAVPETYVGYYETDGFESSLFRLKDGPNEHWWLKGSLPCSFLNFDQDRNRPFRRVYVEIQGNLSPLGQYGHMGFYQREISVTHMVSCRPLREDERVEP
jgi:hypothetical protein